MSHTSPRAHERTPYSQMKEPQLSQNSLTTPLSCLKSLGSPWVYLKVSIGIWVRGHGRVSRSVLRASKALGESGL